MDARRMQSDDYYDAKFPGAGGRPPWEKDPYYDAKFPGAPAHRTFSDGSPPMKKRVIVCGSRRWRDRDAIVNRLFKLPADTTIVHGNAQGADRIAHQEAQKLGLLVEPHPADWERYGKTAGPIRNKLMADLGADLCIAFWDGLSTGTRNMIDQAEKVGIPVEVIT